MDDLIAEFLTETNENLGELDLSLVKLEQNPDDKELLSKIFRVMHTIKGTSGFLNLPRLGSVAHKAEDLLGLFRDGKLQPNPAYISLILEALDRIKIIMASIEGTGREPEGEDGELINRLAQACERQEMENPMPMQDAAAMAVTGNIDAPDAPKGESSLTPESSVAAQTLRVNVEVLEDLMTLVSELVLTRNQILQVARTQKDSEISGSLQRLNHIVSELQEGVMKTRMQPVGSAWSKLPRIVRDIANDLGKRIELDMFGQETELDRQVLEMIKDPLTHMVRNSADHGIEKPADRLAAGKTETGRITLNSYHEGGHIIIEIADDGRGLSLEKIKKKILQNKLATETELAAMSPQQIQQYIFAAGFSTAEQVTAVSGRGVGMDVVRTNIEKIGGSIEMSSTEGQGTTFTIKIPLTLAIVSSLIVGIDNERFAIPQLDVTELVMVTPAGPNRIEDVNGTPVFRLRERILPLICLRSLLGFTPNSDKDKPSYIAVISVGSYRFGIIVDRVFDTEEIVVKPVTSLLNGQAVFSGNTILGDGHVIMILDSSGILKVSGITGNSSIQREQKSESISEAGSKKEIPLLLFNAGSNSLKAVPLQHVARLEEIDLANVELAGGQRVIQYGETLMPVYLYNQSDIPAEGRRPVIVFKTRNGLSGLIVDRILDITAHSGEYQIKSEGSLEGTAIIQGKATDIINLSFEKPRNPEPQQNGHMASGFASYFPVPDVSVANYGGVK